MAPLAAAHGPASCPPDRWRPPPLDKGTPKPVAAGSGVEGIFGTKDPCILQSPAQDASYSDDCLLKGWRREVYALGDLMAARLADQIARTSPQSAAGAFISLTELAAATGRSRSAVRACVEALASQSVQRKG